jgi:hypothetical protein
MTPPYFKFVSSYTQNLYQSEDVYFLENAKRVGYKVHVDTEHTCNHWGPCGFGVSDFEKQMVLKNNITGEKK